MFKKTEHTDLCIRTTDGAELWHSTYMLGVHSQTVTRSIVVHTLRFDESRAVTESLLNLIEGRTAPVTEMSYRTYKLATQWGFYNIAAGLREKLIRDPTLEFLRMERNAADYPKALHAYMTGTADGNDIIADVVREYRELYEVARSARKHLKGNAAATAMRTMDEYFNKHKK